MSQEQLLAAMLAKFERDNMAGLAAWFAITHTPQPLSVPRKFP